MGWARRLLLLGVWGAGWATAGTGRDRIVDDPESYQGTGGGYPLVLAHGFIASADDGFTDAIVQALQSDGIQVFRTQVPSIASVAVRGQVLAEQIVNIVKTTNAGKVHIIAHSMGGLDARQAATLVGDRIASITTISAPHRGSVLADIALGVNGGITPNAAVLEILGALLGVTVGNNPQLTPALTDLSEAQAVQFNTRVADVPGIVYQSWAGLSTLGGRVNPNDVSACTGTGGVLLMASTRDSLRPVFAASGLVLAGLEQKPHDGVVTVASARWGHFRGCLPADHFDETEAAPDVQTGFDAVTFYRDLARELNGSPALQVSGAPPRWRTNRPL